MSSADVVAMFRKLHLESTKTIPSSSTSTTGALPYITKIAVQSQPSSSTSKIATACLDEGIHLFSKETLQEETVISEGYGTVSDLKFGKSDPNLLYSCSSDKTLRCWDLRINGDKGKEVQKFKAPLKGEYSYLSLDVNQSEVIVCAGTEMDDSQDTHLLFWDRRGGSLLGSYTDSHDDAITRVSFQPGSDSLLASAGSDGIVCVFDVSNQTEDDALQMTFNIEACVDSLGWCGSSYSDVYSITSDHRFYSWDALQGDDRCFIPRDSLLKEDERDYIIDYIPGSPSNSNKCLLLAGNHSGKLSVVHRNEDGEVAVISTLNGGHTDVIRCLHWDAQTNRLLTGGEDAKLCLWSVQEQSIPGAMGKMSISQDRGARKKPYDKKKSNKK